MNTNRKKGMDAMELTKSEMEIMDVFWASETPLSRSDLLSCSDGKSWKDSSVHILLNGLLKKDLIHEAGLVKRRKTYGRLFAPSMTREEYFVTNVFSYRNKPQPVKLFQALLDRIPLTPEQMQDMAALLTEAQNRKPEDIENEEPTLG